MHIRSALAAGSAIAGSCAASRSFGSRAPRQRCVTSTLSKRNQLAWFSSSVFWQFQSARQFARWRRQQRCRLRLQPERLARSALCACSSADTSSDESKSGFVLRSPSETAQAAPPVAASPPPIRRQIEAQSRLCGRPRLCTVLLAVCCRTGPKFCAPRRQPQRRQSGNTRRDDVDVNDALRSPSTLTSPLGSSGQRR